MSTDNRANEPTPVPEGGAVVTDEFLGLRKVAEQGVIRGVRMPLDARTVLALLDRVETAERRVSRLKNREQKAFGKLRESRAALQRVRELHREEDHECIECSFEPMPDVGFRGVSVPYPCPTIRALEEDE